MYICLRATQFDSMTKRVLFSIYLAFFFGTFLNAQDALWFKNSTESTKASKDQSGPSQYDLYTLNKPLMQTQLLRAKIRNQGSLTSGLHVKFPNVEGKLINYEVYEAPVMHPELAKKFPDNKSYVGIATNGSGNTARFSLNGLGLFAAIYTSGKATIYIDPDDLSTNRYKVYSRENIKAVKSFQCLTESESATVKSGAIQKNANDLQLRTFELALATTGEYAQFHINAAGLSGGTEAQQRAAVMDALTVTMTRVNGVFERELALTMQLIPNNDLLIYLDGASDPYTNGNGVTMLGENQANIDSVIGFANYDIGHVFSTGGGGVAFLGSPCGGSKAGGVTGLTSPVGDAFDIDFVAHEMGHQFGANHTFNGTAGSCSGSNRNNATAVEPGSGSTIMAYAGICSPQNVQLNSDDYFHHISIQQMFNFISSGSSTCDDETAFTTNSNAPTADAGNDFTVPKSTPLILRGQGSDLDGDTLTYTWEQIDNETTGISIPPSSSQTGGALFRSVAPDDSPNRYLPALGTVVAGNLSSSWEVLPSVGRTMEFAFTVRDNAPGEGQTASDVKTVFVDNNSGPFTVTSQAAKDVFWAVGSSQTISWDVAGTDTAPVNSPTVDIWLSLDGGFTYPISLATATVNDGSHAITVPNNLTSTARVRVEGSNHIFYALNASDITIVNDFGLIAVSSIQSVCIPDDAIYDFAIDFAAGFNELVNFSVSNLPAGTNASFSPSSTSSNSNVQLTIDGTTNLAPGTYNFSVLGTTTSVTRQLDLILEIFDATIKAPVLSSPVDGAVGVLALGTSLNWDSDANVSNYLIEIATDAVFSTIIESATLAENSYVPQNLVDATTYYWRVQPSNICATADFSSVNTFTTSEIVCQSFDSSDTPLTIPDNDPTGVSSVLNITEDFIISDVNLSIAITHSWMRDLIITLESPLGTEVELINRQCSGASGNQNMAATFDDLGVELVCASSSPVITGVIIPSEALAAFNGESTIGDWTLRISDNAALDTGSLTNWSLELCESVEVASVFDEAFENLAIWPNPASDVVNISFSSTHLSDTQIKIFDVLGREVLNKKYTNGSVLFNEQVTVDHLTSGTYLMNISRQNANTTKRVVIF